MTDLSVKETLAALEGGRKSGKPNVLPIRFVDERGPVRLLFGVDPDGASCVLIAAPGASSSLPVFRTNAFSCEFASAARIQLGTVEETCAALIVRCNRATEYRDVLAALVEEVRATLTLHDGKKGWSEVGKLLARWGEFFAEPESLSDASALGLWGELLVVDAGLDTSGALASWRGSEGATYDFFRDGFALEVKTSRKREVHRVSHAQAPGAGVEGILLSLEVSEDPGGRSLSDLENSLLSKLEHEAPYFEALRRRGVHPLSLRRCEKSWALVRLPSAYRLADVPRVTGVEPGVSDLTYVIRLEASKKLSGRDEKHALDRFGLRFK